MDNIDNQRKDYNQIIEIGVKNNVENSTVYFEPKWVPLRRMKMTADGRLVPDDSLYVPSNLLGDIEKGNIDPEKYTREELKRMSFIRQQDQAMIEQYAKAKQEYNEVENRDTISYDFGGNSKKI